MIRPLLILLFWCVLECRARLTCEIKYGQNRLMYNVSNEAALGITLTPGTSIDFMQVFHCTCPTSNEYFDDTEVTNIDRDFFKVNAYDWTQSQIFQIHNCTMLTLSLRNGKNTFSNLLKGKLLILENIQQLVMTAFTAGFPSVTTEDDVFSSIYFRNVTFFQVPPYFEFDDRYEILFQYVYTDEGSNKVEPFDIRVKNNNYTRNPVFRMEMSRFGGINIITDGYTFNVFTLTVQNLQKADNYSCNYDYKGSVRLIGNSFGYLRSRNIYITNGMEFVFEDNFVDTLNINSFDLSNLKQTRLRNNMFGYLLLDPTINLAFYRGGSGSCTVQDLPEAAVTMMDFSGNRVQRLDVTFLNLNADPGYSTGFVNKANTAGMLSSRPCNCTDPNLGYSPTSSQRLILTAIQQSQCLSPQRIMGPRSDICSGRNPLSPEQELARRNRETANTWLIYLIAAVAATAIIVAIVTGVCCRVCCKCKGDDVKKSNKLKPDSSKVFVKRSREE